MKKYLAERLAEELRNEGEDNSEVITKIEQIGNYKLEINGITFRNLSKLLRAMYKLGQRSDMDLISKILSTVEFNFRYEDRKFILYWY